MKSISKGYEPHEVEKKWYSVWIDSGTFEGAVSPGKEHYSIVIPPPNITGVLHMGHVLNNTLQDILIRRARLEGKAAVWIPGTDHASIATHSVLERQLKKEGTNRYALGRDKFIERAWAWREKHGAIIIDQLKRLGVSCDWSRTKFTMDADYSESVFRVFIESFRRGYIYRGKKMVNWCPATQTALSDEEVNMKSVAGVMYRVRYECIDAPGQFIEVKTTRPETIPGDVAIAVHPEDVRYAGWIGKKVRRPIGPPGELVVIADAVVDKEFGTGALKITPAHDKTDYEIGQRHNLPIIDVLDATGVLNQQAGSELAGLERFAGRKKAAELLRACGALVAEEAYTNNVGYSERADVPIEPRLTWQWWLRYPRVEEAKAAVRDGHIQFHPERWSKVYLHWLENIHDWCISRQLWWGHRIPVWYRKGMDRDSLSEADLRDPQKVHVSLSGPPDPENWEQETDVLDTWASSWLWPFVAMGWPDKNQMAKAGFATFYPTTTLVTGPDIIFFWVARMIMAGLEFVHPEAPLSTRIPFRHVYFTGIIRDDRGRKMSKSLGNSPDPLDLIAKYGADGLRIGIISIAPQGQDIRFQEERIEAGKNFCNKLWNACRFRQLQGEAEDRTTVEAIAGRLDVSKFDSDDHAILDRLIETTDGVAKAFAEFEFNGALQALYTLFWADFCDWYVEVSKSKVADDHTRRNCLAIQDLALRQVLLLLHPFAPFITEELWEQLQFSHERSLLTSEGRVPTGASLRAALGNKGIVIDQHEVARAARVKTFVTQARSLKADQGQSGRRDVSFQLVANDSDWKIVNAHEAKLKRMLGASAITRNSLLPEAGGVVTVLGTLSLGQASSGNSAADRARLSSELATLLKHITATEARLNNSAFVDKAPPAVIEGARRQLAELKEKRRETEALLGGTAS